MLCSLLCGVAHVDECAGISFGMLGSALRFESRPEDKPAAPPRKPKAKAASAAAVDSSDSELSELSEDDDGEVKAADGWEHNDHVSMSQRVKDELESLSQPKLTLQDYKTKSLYEYALHFLPVAREGEETGMLEALADRMTTALAQPSSKMASASMRAGT